MTLRFNSIREGKCSVPKQVPHTLLKFGSSTQLPPAGVVFPSAVPSAALASVVAGGGDAGIS
jgi:hypothetical protein